MLIKLVVVPTALAAILFPVFASVRHRARMTACASNLHQIALALHQYQTDNDGYFPPGDPVLSHQPHLVWTLLTPYTHTTDVFHCPDALTEFEKTWGYNYINGSWPYTVGMVSKANNPFLKAPRPGSGTVVAFCNAHTKRDGSGGWLDDPQGQFIVVREDGSTSQISLNHIEAWIYRNETWMPGRGVRPQPGDWIRPRFPSEEWPPQD